MNPLLRSKSLLTLCIGLFIFTSPLIGQKMDGITIVAPPKPFNLDPFNRVMETGSGWVCLVPYGYTRMGTTRVHFDTERQWWGERTVGVQESINLAQKHHLNIMLKPQVYFPGSWPGDLTFETEEDWTAWEEDYRTFILHWAELANTYELELFCIGTEFKLSIQQRPEFWANLIKEIKSIYCGKITYSANWDEYPLVPFWDELDYIGISAYFPLLQEDTPDVNSLIKSWKPIKSTLEQFSNNLSVPILFTEYGYLSTDGCCGKTWILEKDVRNLDINQTCQANGFDALLQVFGDENWWAGGFIWKWFPEGKGHEGYPAKDYTPQNKQAEAVISKYYTKW